jgi:hypothetical protein
MLRDIACLYPNVDITTHDTQRLDFLHEPHPRHLGPA